MDAKKVQDALAALEFNSPDPIFNIMSFQVSKLLVVDGVAGPKTLALLFPPETISTPAAPYVPSLYTTALVYLVCSKAKPELAVVFTTNGAMLRNAGVTTPLIAAHFLAQVAVETGGLHAIEESLNYSANGLRATFGAHRITDAQCQAFGRTSTRSANQEMIANTVYGGAFGRNQLGNTQTGDGWRYRGGGMLQTTGRANYTRIGHADDPDALRQPQTALESALKFWKDNGLSALAATDDIVAVRKRINGGTNGLDEAKNFLKLAKRAFNI